MWTCPKCGRTFKRQEQSHYCGKAPETIEGYIAAQPEGVQQYLKEVRDTLRAALPEAEERSSWSMPTYWKKHNIIQFAGFKNHVGLYPGPEAVQEFSERLKCTFRYYEIAVGAYIYCRHHHCRYRRLARARRGCQYP